MTSPTKRQPPRDLPVSTYPEWVPPTVTLALILHLFCVWVALSSNVSRSMLQARLLEVLAPYTQLLNIDPDFTPYYLTQATRVDVDHRIEILPEGEDAADPSRWIVLPSSGNRASDNYKRYQRLAETLALNAENQDMSGLIAQSVATNYWKQHGVKPQQVRARRHLLQQREWISGGTGPQRDPNDPMHFETAYLADIIITSSGKVFVNKIDEAGQVAQPTATP